MKYSSGVIWNTCMVILGLPFKLIYLHCMEKLLQYKDILPKISIYKGFFHFETLSGVSVTDFEMLMTDVTTLSWLNFTAICCHLAFFASDLQHFPTF